MSWRLRCLGSGCRRSWKQKSWRLSTRGRVVRRLFIRVFHFVPPHRSCLESRLQQVRSSVRPSRTRRDCSLTRIASGLVGYVFMVSIAAVMLGRVRSLVRLHKHRSRPGMHRQRQNGAAARELSARWTHVAHELPGWTAACQTMLEIACVCDGCCLFAVWGDQCTSCLLYTSPSPRD